MTAVESRYLAATDLDDKEVAEIRALAAVRVAGFPPLTREQAMLVRALLTGAAQPSSEASR